MGSPRQSAWIFSVLVLALSFVGCGGAKKVTVPPLPHFTGPLTAQQFHNVGAVAGARPLGTGETASERLHVDRSAVNAYVNSLCSGNRPVLPLTLSSFAEQV